MIYLFGFFQSNNNKEWLLSETFKILFSTCITRGVPYMQLLL